MIAPGHVPPNHGKDPGVVRLMRNGPMNWFSPDEPLTSMEQYWLEASHHAAAERERRRVEELEAALSLLRRSCLPSPVETWRI